MRTHARTAFSLTARGTRTIRMMDMGKRVWYATESQPRNVTGCPEKNAPQFLLNFSGCKHARRLGHNSLERHIDNVGIIAGL